LFHGCIKEEPGNYCLQSYKVQGENGSGEKKKRRSFPTTLSSIFSYPVETPTRSNRDKTKQVCSKAQLQLQHQTEKPGSTGFQNPASQQKKSLRWKSKMEAGIKSRTIRLSQQHQCSGGLFFGFGSWSSA
jgi:hypothetical protein